MNKIVAVLLVLGVAAVYVDAGKGKHEKHEKQIKECQAQEKATDEDVKTFMKMSKPMTTKEGKCLVGCMFEKHGFLVNGAFSKENSEKWIEKMFADDQEKQQEAKTALASCEADLSGVPKDKCETGPVLRECFGRLKRQMQKKNEGQSE